NADGSYTFDVGGAFQDLDATESRDVTFTYTATDDQGNVSAPATVTITVTGTDDSPVAQVHTDGAVEDGAVIAGNVPAATDLDGDVDANGYALVTSVGEGTLVVNTDGSYTFDVGSDFQDLNATESRDVTFTYTATDDQGNISAPATVTITVTGTNDAPTLSIADLSATEDGATVSGTPTFSDTDLSDTDAGGYTVTAMPAGQGSVSINPTTGEYTFDPGTDFQSLAQGATTDVSFDVTVTDNNGLTATETVTVTVTGTNDAPTLTIVDLNASEDGATVSGTPTFSDTDLGDTDAGGYTVTAMPAGQGSVSIDPTTGEYTFDPGSDFQSLAQGATTDVSFDVTVTDNNGLTATETVTVTVTGTNDASVVSSVSQTLTETDAILSTSGTLTSSDVDDIDNVFTPITVVGSIGTFTMDAAGAWTFTANSTFDSLDEMQSVNETFNVTSVDGTPSTVQITIAGTNDAPVLSGNFTGTVSESGLTEGTAAGSAAEFISGALTFSDLDDRNTLMAVVNGIEVGVLDGTTSAIGTVAGDYGTWTLHGDGTWKYGLQTAVDHEAIGAPAEQFLVTVDDGGNRTTEITIDISITDDGLTADNVSVIATATGGLSLQGVLNVEGADVAYSGDLTDSIPGWSATGTTHTDSGLTSGGWAVYYHIDPADPATLVAYRDTAGNNPYEPSSATQSKIFQLSVDPNSDSYSLSTFGVVIDNTTSANFDTGQGGNANVLVMFDTGSGYDLTQYGTLAEWAADTATYDSTMMTFTASSVNGSGTRITETVNSSNLYMGVGNNLITGSNGEQLVIGMHDAPTSSLSLKMDVSVGQYTWTALDTSGAVLGSGTSADEFLEISGIGPMQQIVIEGADATSKFRVVKSGTSADLITNEADNEADIGQLTFQVDVTDNDGDVVSTFIDISLANGSDLTGTSGDDQLFGGDDHDSLFGGTGNDILTGGVGLDFLSGGTGNDILTGGAESDVFSWSENDRGSLSSPDQDSITDFTVGDIASGGDVLGLSDLLQGEESNPLTDYLSISVGDFDTDGDIDTRIAVDSDGGIFFQPSLQITLEGVDLSEGGALTDQDILNNLITDGNLDTDV
ncbi:MAG: beta strand repeat-containing protein, partial [Planctomycetota bacterium]